MSFKEWFEGWFGATLPESLYFEENGKKVFAKRFEGKEEKAEKEGLIAAKVSNGNYKPTTNFLQLYGNLTLRNVVLLDEEQAERFMRGESIEVGLEGRGYVAVCFKNACLGCGFLRDGMVENQVPKVRRVKA